MEVESLRTSETIDGSLQRRVGSKKSFIFTSTHPVFSE